MTAHGTQLPDPEYALMYASRAAQPASDTDLQEILRAARTKNQRLAITGILLYRKERFYQYLEGPQEALHELFAEIVADPRHHRVQVLYEAVTRTRRFHDWSMGYEPLREPQIATPAGFRSTFDDLEDVEHPERVLRAVSEVALWYQRRARQRESQLSE